MQLFNAIATSAVIGTAFLMTGTGQVLLRSLRSANRRQLLMPRVRGVLEPMVRAGLSYTAMAEALAGVGKVSSTGRLLASAQIGRILQSLGLSGKLLGSDQAWVAA